MVGRPYPKTGYEYTGESKPSKKEKKEDEEDLDKEIKRLEDLRERAVKKSKMRTIKKETFELEHPGIVEGSKKGKKAIGRAASFIGMVSRDTVRPFKRTTGKRRIKGRRIRTPISTRAGEDISLTKAIAANDWSGSGLMDRDFFGTDPDRELLPSGHKEMDLISDKNKKNIRLI